MAKRKLTTRQAAAFLCISYSNITKKVASKQIPHSKVGRLNIFDEDELQAYLEYHRVRTVEELEKLADDKLIYAKSKTEGKESEDKQLSG